MVEFKKGYWNLEELQIQEWYEPKQIGYQDVDIKALESYLLKDLEENFNEEIAIKASDIIRKRFGFDENEP